MAQGEWRDKSTIVVDFERGLCAKHLKDSPAESPKRSNGVQAVHAVSPTPPPLSSRPEDASPQDGKGEDEKDGGDRVALIPIQFVRPNPDQPRKHFDRQALEDLATSIKYVGQLQPILVRDVIGTPHHKFEIIDGERRWRAHRIAHIPKIKAIIIAVEGADHQFEMSAVSNFCRQPHMELEEANAIQQIMQQRKRTPAEVALAFGKPLLWITMRLKLLELDPQVHEFMAPEHGRRRLVASVASQLAALPKPVQVELAATIFEKQLKMSQALHIIRKRIEELGMPIKTGKRGRKPADEMTIFQRYLRNTQEGAQCILEAPDRLLTGLFQFQGPARVEETIALVDQNIQHLNEIRATLERVLNRTG